MATKLSREEMVAMLNSYPKELAAKVIEKIVLDNNKATEKTIANLAQLIDLESVVIAGIAVRDNIPLERIMYDINNSYYKELNDKKVNVKDFQYPSDFAQDAKVEPVEPEIQVYESENKEQVQTFKEKIISKLNEEIQKTVNTKENELIEKLKLLKKNR